MANASMNIKSFIEVATVLPVERSVIIRADHGVGKSMITRLVTKLRATTKFDGIERELIDIRLSQMTDGDMLGLPSTDGRVTRWNPMEWFQKACEKPCMLFLDELNRATTEIMQAAFQIILDRELAGRKLHKDTLVYAAVNTSGQYTVNQIDAALLDRFFVCDLVPSKEEWLEWAQTINEETNLPNIHPLFVDFNREYDAWLDSPATKAEADDVSPSRRAWFFTSDSMVKSGVVNRPTENIFINIAKGFLGQEAAIKLQSFALTFDQKITSEDVLERYTDKDVQKRLLNSKDRKTTTFELWNELIDKVSDHVNVQHNLTDLTDVQAKNLKAFMTDLPHELRVRLWSELVKKGSENFTFIQAVSKECIDLILDVFGMKAGEAGLAMTPNIPAMFSSDTKS